MLKKDRLLKMHTLVEDCYFRLYQVCEGSFFIVCFNKTVGQELCNPGGLCSAQNLCYAAPYLNNYRGQWRARRYRVFFALMACRQSEVRNSFVCPPPSVKIDTMSLYNLYMAPGPNVDVPLAASCTLFV